MNKDIRFYQQKDHIEKYLKETVKIISLINIEDIMNFSYNLVHKKRLFILGIGGSAANASHAVNDFRKICGIECYTPTDNISEITARTNDDGWDSVFVNWLRISKLNSHDAVLVFSVGGGNSEKNISTNIVNALEYAKSVNAVILGIVGRDGGHTANVAESCVVIPTVNHETITPHTEEFQSIILHLLVSSPFLKKHETKWENTK